MCGIFGHTFSGNNNIGHSRDSLNTLVHRGPDQWDDWQDSEVYIGHRRLSILDLSENGKQPMFDNCIVISVNGEIYNYQDVKSELEKKHRFTSSSDSEVILHGYKEWGIQKLLNKIEGMYAFVIYDRCNKKIILARDRVGIKPLYYSHIENQYAWGSELKALISFYKNRKLKIDETAVYDFLTYLYIPTPKSLYKNIYKLEPAHYMEINLQNRQCSKHRYWQLSINTITTSHKKAVQQLKNRLHASIEAQMMGDVPVGFFLSGGLDSSTVVAYASHTTKKLNTYSIGFDIQEHDETLYAQIVANTFGTNHIRSQLNIEEGKLLLQNLPFWYDEPHADTSVIPTYLVSTLARETSKVVLTGDGGDEVFGGYTWYKNFLDNVSLYKNIDAKLEFYSNLMNALPKEKRKVYAKQLGIKKDYDDYWYFRKYYNVKLPTLTRMQYLDFNTYLPDDILTKVDRASMAVSLEARVPFLATNLVEFSFSLPENIRYYNRKLKGLLKQAVSNTLPNSIVTRDKKGFSIPLGRWKANLIPGYKHICEYILHEQYQNVINL